MSSPVEMKLSISSAPTLPTPATPSKDAVPVSSDTSPTSIAFPGGESPRPGVDEEAGGRPGDDGESSVRELPAKRFWLLSIGICFGLFLSMLDSSIVATSLLSIGKELGSFSKLNWVALAYTLSNLGCAVVFARVADIVGRRDAYLAAFFLFFAFSLGCGFAQNIDQLIACRALQGVGGAGLFSQSMIIWPEVAPVRMQQYISSLAGVVVGMAGVLGPVLGGILTHYTTWRWVFWLNGPIGLVSMIVFAITWPKAEQLPPFRRRPWTSLDVVGSLLLIAAAVLVTFSFQNAGSDGLKWTHAVFLAPLIVGTLCWGALFLWEWNVEKRWRHMMAAFPMSLLRNRVYFATFLTTMCLGFPFFVIIYTFPLRLQAVNSKSPLDAGIMLLPMLGGVAVGSFISGAINTHANRLFETFVASSCLLILGCALETTLSDSVAVEAKSLGFLVFIGIGCGLGAASSTIMASFEAPPGEHAPSQGIIAQIRMLGGSIGIAASTAIMAGQEIAKLGHIVTTSALDLSSPKTEAEAKLVREIFSQSFTEDMRVCAIISAFCLLFSFGTYRKDRSRPTHIRQRPEDDDEEKEDLKSKAEPGKMAQKEASETTAAQEQAGACGSSSQLDSRRDDGDEQSPQAK